jgi:organic hydroperoxide reductase OsmC/OhrA
MNDMAGGLALGYQSCHMMEYGEIFGQKTVKMREDCARTHSYHENAIRE